MPLPFKDGWEPYPGTSDGYFYPEGPADTIVRVTPIPPHATDPFAAVTTMKRLLNELEPTYGIRSIPPALALGREDTRGEYEISNVVPIINGRSVNFQNDPRIVEPDDVIPSMQLTGQLFGYIQNKADSGDAILMDIFGTYQYLMEPDGILTLVDVASPMSVRRDECETPVRHARSIFFALEMLLQDCVHINNVDSRQKHVWADRAREVIETIRSSSGLTFSAQKEDELVETYLCGEYEDMEAIYINELQRQERY